MPLQLIVSIGLLAYKKGHKKVEKFYRAMLPLGWGLETLSTPLYRAPFKQTTSLGTSQVMDEYNLTQRERRVIMDEVRGRTGNARALRPPLEPPKVDHKKTSPKSSYLELLRCGGKIRANGAAAR